VKKVSPGSSKEECREESKNTMRAEKTEVLKRLSYIEGHLKGIRKMVDEDRYCVDIVRQTYAVRMAIAKLEAIILENHLQTCVPEAITNGQAKEVIEELIQLYHLAEKR
jgi:DNA-binding FrmR family transcriptional regulator